MEHEGSEDKTVLSLRKKRACSVEGCEGKHKAKDLCKRHYDLISNLDEAKKNKRIEKDRRRRALLSKCPIYREKERVRALFWRNQNLERRRATEREYKKQNRAKRTALQASRRASKLRATPKWLSATQKAEIRQKYELAAKWTKETGVKHVVDHTSPLKSEQICGLHVPWNLRVIPEALNASKNNKIDTALITDPNGHRDIHVSELNSAPAITAKSG